MTASSPGKKIDSWPSSQRTRKRSCRFLPAPRGSRPACLECRPRGPRPRSCRRRVRACRGRSWSSPTYSLVVLPSLPNQDRIGQGLTEGHGRAIIVPAWARSRGRWRARAGQESRPVGPLGSPKCARERQRASSARPKGGYRALHQIWLNQAVSERSEGARRARSLCPRGSAHRADGGPSRLRNRGPSAPLGSPATC
jgi:hypothetical protein